MLDLLPERNENSNKGDFGKVLCICGSKGMAGAAFLSAYSAYKVGAGLVRIYTHEDNRVPLQTLLPEAIVDTYNIFLKKRLRELLDWASVILIGCGLGTDIVSKEIVSYTLTHTNKPVVIDADGLNILAKLVKSTLFIDEINHLRKDKDADDMYSEKCNNDKANSKDTDKKKEDSENKDFIEGKNSTENSKFEYPNNWILTPHIKELSRLIGESVEDIKSNREGAVNIAVVKYKSVIVSKDSETLVGESFKTLSKSERTEEIYGIKIPEEAYEYVMTYKNTTGNAALAKGGSGDVLAGIIVGFLAQHLTLYRASTLGAYIHGRAGELASKKLGMYSVMARDVIENISEAMKR